MLFVDVVYLCKLIVFAELYSCMPLPVNDFTAPSNVWNWKLSVSSKRTRTNFVRWHSLKYLASHLTYPLIARVVGTPQMISQPVSSIFLCSLPSSGTWRTPGLSIPWCCLPIASSVCFVFFPLSVPCNTVLAKPVRRKTCPYYFSLRLFTLARCLSGPPVRLPARSWHGFPRW